MNMNLKGAERLENGRKTAVNVRIYLGGDGQMFIKRERIVTRTKTRGFSDCFTHLELYTLSDGSDLIVDKKALTYIV